MSAEDRVAAALHALATQTGAPVDGEARLRDRLRREHRLRRGGALLGSVAVVAGIAVAAGTLGNGGGSALPEPLPFATAASPSPSPAPFPDPSDLARLQAEKDAAASSPSPSAAPTYPPPAAGVGGPGYVMTVESNGTYGWRNARTGELGTTEHPAGYRVVDVTSLGDETTYYDAAVKPAGKGKCGTSMLQRVVLKRPGDPSYETVSDVPGSQSLRGEVEAIAISRDGTRLAYVLGAGVDSYGYCSLAHNLVVVDVRTGKTRTWTGSDTTLSDLNWAPDSRTLLLHTQGCCGDYWPELHRFDTRVADSLDELVPVPGTTVKYDKTSNACPDGVGVTTSASSRSEVFAVQECFAEPSSARLVVLDPTSGRVLREVATIVGIDRIWSLSVTPDGRHILLSAPAYPDQRNIRIDNGHISQLPTQLTRMVW